MVEMKNGLKRIFWIVGICGLLCVLFLSAGCMRSPDREMVELYKTKSYAEINRAHQSGEIDQATLAKILELKLAGKTAYQVISETVQHDMPTESIDDLIAHLEYDEEYTAENRALFVKTLSFYGSQPKVVSALTEALKHKDGAVRNEAAVALGNMNAGNSVPELMEAWYSFDNKVSADPRLVESFITIQPKAEFAEISKSELDTISKFFVEGISQTILSLVSDYSGYAERIEYDLPVRMSRAVRVSGKYSFSFAIPRIVCDVGGLYPQDRRLPPIKWDLFAKMNAALALQKITGHPASRGRLRKAPIIPKATTFKEYAIETYTQGTVDALRDIFYPLFGLERYAPSYRTLANVKEIEEKWRNWYEQNKESFITGS
ncbi:MAG: HEAT repeat domain-containing protein [Sedimentisphaerales bacterium]